MGMADPLSTRGVVQRRGLLRAGGALGAMGLAGFGLSGCDARREIPGGFVGASDERGHLLRDARGLERLLERGPVVTRKTHTVIAGGGIAGLAAARALRHSGIDDFALLELEDEAGGNSRGGMLNGNPCPLGAHYLPVPGDAASDVQDLLEEFGLRRRVAGRWQYDERYLCHSPQERLFIREHWQEGLLPMVGIGADTMAQYRRFAEAVARLRQAAQFTIPVSKLPLSLVHRALDAIVFKAWLDREGLDDAYLRWFLDYCCRDDFGAGIDRVSAWAGIHYFASRHGFHAPGDESEEREQVLTWPEGNGWLVRRLAEPLGDRLKTGRVVLRIDAGRHGVAVDAFDAASQTIERWEAAHCIVCLPLFVAARVLTDPLPALTEAAAQLQYAPWLVSNLHLDAPLEDRLGAERAWDNVIFGSASLGYVDATHQSLRSVPGPTVLTHYHALLATEASPAAARRALLDRPWTHWRDRVLAELAPVHPDLAAKATRMEMMRWGHAMSIPVPGIRASAALSALQQMPPSSRLRFAHGDLSGYSIFEEAFDHGHRAGLAVARRPDL
ncbi:MAG: FAD-dependent oxidoreductase [Burkholderiales bacterium]